MTKADPKNLIVKAFIKLGKKLNRFPTNGDLVAAGIDRNKIRYYFKDKSGLQQYVEENHPKDFKEISSKESNAVSDKEKKVRLIVSRYVRLAEKSGHHPTYEELQEVGLEKSFIKCHFSNLKDLKSEAEVRFPEEMSLIFDEEALLNEDRILQTEENIRKYERLVISSIGTGVTDDYIEGCYTYCKLNSARLVLMVTEMDFSRIDPYLKQEYIAGNLDIVFQDVIVNKSLTLNTVMINERVVNPTAGIGRQSVQNAKSSRFPSFIFASPKQTLRSIPDKYGKFPRMQMSPGAITRPNYIVKKFKRTKRRLMAENDHLIGAIIVEKEGDYFYARQTQRGEKGSFIDWGVQYHKDGTASVLNPESFVMGDLHSKKKCVPTFELWLELIKTWKTKAIVHDIYDSASQNPHEMHKPISAMVSMLEGDTSTPDEIATLVKDLERIRSVAVETFIPDSNHDDMLARSFDNGAIWKIPQNAFLGSLLMPMAVLHQMRDEYTEDQISGLVQEKLNISKEVLYRMYPNLCKPYSLLQFACELYGLKSGKDLIWGRLESSYKSGEFELADHGHKGANGAKGSANTFRQSFPKYIHGHTHTEYQLNFIASVGHSTAGARYAKGGLSGWTKSSAIVYGSGQFQQLRSINGKVRSFKNAFIPEETRLANKRIEKLQDTNREQFLKQAAA